MSAPLGPNELASIQKATQSKAEAELRKELEAELTKIREEISQDKIRRAEQHSGYMRNWLALLTATISFLLVGSGYLSYTRMSEIEAHRKQIATDAADVKSLSNEVRDEVKKVADSVTVIQTHQQRIADLDSKINKADARITASDKNIGDIEKRARQAEPQIIAAVALAQRTHNDFQSGVASGFLGEIPSISIAHVVQGPALSSVEGRDFGNTAGHIYVDIQRITLTSTLQLPTRIEIQPPFEKWTDTKIEFHLSPSEYQKIRDARASQTSASSVSGTLGNVRVNLSEGLTASVFLSLVIETSQGRLSISGDSLRVSWP